MTARRRERRAPSLPATPVLRLGAHCFLAGDEDESEHRAPGLGRGVGFQGRGPAVTMDTASVMTEFRWVGGLGRRGPGHAGSSSLASLAAGIWVLLRLPGMGTHASRVDWARQLWRWKAGFPPVDCSCEAGAESVPPGRGGWADGGSGSPIPVPVGLLRTGRVDPAFQGLKEPLLKHWSNLPLRADWGWFAAGKTSTQRDTERVQEQALIPQLQRQLTTVPSLKHQLPEEERRLGSGGQPQERRPPAPSPPVSLWKGLWDRVGGGALFSSLLGDKAGTRQGLQ